MRTCASDGCGVQISNRTASGLCRACYKRAWAIANETRVREKRQRYYQERKKEFAARDREYRVANRDLVQERQRAWQSANRDRYLDYHHQYNLARRDRQREYARNHYQTNRERYRDVSRAHYVEKPEAYAAYRQMREALKRGASVAHRIHRDAIWYRDGGSCYICRQPADPQSWHLDHTIPLAAGDAENSYRNCGVACQPCNRSKGDADPRTDPRYAHLLAAIAQRESSQPDVDRYLLAKGLAPPGIRDWARSRGLAVAATGRISASLLAAYSTYLAEQDVPSAA